MIELSSTFWWILGLGGILAIALILFMIFTSPEGEENETGFHYTKEPDPNNYDSE